MASKDSAVSKQGESPLAAALGKTIGKVLTQQDYEEGSLEKPLVRYLQLRQKDLKGEGGKMLQQAGGFRVGSVTDLAEPDREEIHATVLAFVKNRVYFASLSDRKPTCKSLDMASGSRDRETARGRQVYGDCATCWLGQWGSAEGGRQACRENRKLFIVDWEGERPAVLTLGPSSLKPWRTYNDYIRMEASGAAKGGKVPFIHHLIKVIVRPEYRDEPAPHYVVRFEIPTALPEDAQVKMAQFRKDAASTFSEAIKRHEEEAEDYVGGDDEGEGVPVGRGDETPPF